MSLFSFSQYTLTKHVSRFLFLTKHVSRFLFLTKTVSIYLFSKQYVSRSHEVSYCTFSSSDKCIFIYFTFSQNVYLSLSHKMCLSVFLSETYTSQWTTTTATLISHAGPASKIWKDKNSPKFIAGTGIYYYCILLQCSL